MFLRLFGQYINKNQFVRICLGRFRSGFFLQPCFSVSACSLSQQSSLTICIPVALFFVIFVEILGSC